MTEEQIAVVVKSDENAKVLCASGELDGQPHEYKCLAAKGINQHHFHRAKYEEERNLTKQAGVSSKAELTATEAEQMHEHMGSSFDKAPMKQTTRTSTKRTVDSPDGVAYKKQKHCFRLRQERASERSTRHEENSTRCRKMRRKLLLRGIPKKCRSSCWAR